MARGNTSSPESGFPCTGETKNTSHSESSFTSAAESGFTSHVKTGNTGFACPSKT